VWINSTIAGNQFFPQETVGIQEVLLLQSRMCVLSKYRLMQKQRICLGIERDQ
jgi:hypothetical protein